MKKSVKEEVERIIKEEGLNCKVEEFRDKVNWDYISEYQNLSAQFRKEFKNRLK